LFVQLNCSLMEMGYCFPSGEIITAPAPLPDTFTASSKYMVTNLFPLRTHIHQGSQNLMAQSLQWRY
jgi:hypothetical protein